MNADVTWIDIAARLAAALIAGGVIGYDRGTHGRVAGLRTNILMCLAATGAMIEANLLLDVTGKTSASFSVMDTLRFPLGVLSGIGFIGAGAIVRRGRLVTGVTTAATLWLVTVIGLIIGGGYIGLGLSLTAIAFIVLFVLKRVEPRLRREHRALLELTTSGTSPSVDDVRMRIHENGFRIAALSLDYRGTERRLRMRLQWASAKGQSAAPAILEDLRALPGVERLNWLPIDAELLAE